MLPKNLNVLTLDRLNTSQYDRMDERPPSDVGYLKQISISSLRLVSVNHRFGSFCTLVPNSRGRMSCLLPGREG